MTKFQKMFYDIKNTRDYKTRNMIILNTNILTLTK